MDLWFNTCFNDVPNADPRLNNFVVDYDVASVDLTSYVFEDPLENAVSAVKRIAETAPGPYILLASGGVDSQAMIWAWERSGVPYEIWHYSYDNWNYHDTEYLVKFLNKVGLSNKLTIKNLDAISFISSNELINYAKEFDCSSPQILTYIKYAEDTPGTPIMGGNFIQQDVCGISYTLMALQRYSTKQRKNFVPFFFQVTPELSYTFFKKDKNFSILEKSKDAGYRVKCQCYETSGFPIIRQYEKYTGFEKIKKYFDSEEVSNRDRVRWANKPSKRAFDIKYRYNLYDHIGYYSDSKVIIKHHRQINSILNGE
jgi:hypothetical protein